MKIFVSYPHEDGHFVNLLIDYLVESVHKVWWDSMILPGQSWWEVILSKIE